MLSKCVPAAWRSNDAVMSSITVARQRRSLTDTDSICLMESKTLRSASAIRSADSGE